MANALNWAVIAVFAAIVLYYMFTVAMDVSNTSVACEGIFFTGNSTLTAADHTILLYPTPLLYDANDCATPVTNYTVAAGGYTLGFNIANSTYYGKYDYDSPSTVWGMNFSWVAVVAIIGVALALIATMFIKF